MSFNQQQRSCKNHDAILMDTPAIEKNEDVLLEIMLKITKWMWN